jgi:ABC-type uncharacterized transport system substrate-binding protein
LAGAGREGDPWILSSIAKFREGMAKFDWIEGRNLRIDIRFSSVSADRNRACAAELIRLAPDVIVAETAAAKRAVQLEANGIPIVVTGGEDRTRNAFERCQVPSDANLAGMLSIGAKWIELLKEAAPTLQRVALVRSEVAAVTYRGISTCMPAIEDAATAFGVELLDAPYRNAPDIVRTIDKFAANRNGGLLMLPPFPIGTDRDVIHQLTLQHKLPSMCGVRQFAIEGGLMSYGSANADTWRLAASVVDRILRGAKATEIPVELPGYLPLVINVRSAKAIDLAIPDSLLGQADEVIE